MLFFSLSNEVFQKDKFTTGNTREEEWVWDSVRLALDPGSPTDDPLSPHLQFLRQHHGKSNNNTVLRGRWQSFSSQN